MRWRWELGWGMGVGIEDGDWDGQSSTHQVCPRDLLVATIQPPAPARESKATIPAPTTLGGPQTGAATGTALHRPGQAEEREHRDPGVGVRPNPPTCAPQSPVCLFTPVPAQPTPSSGLSCPFPCRGSHGRIPIPGSPSSLQDPHPGIPIAGSSSQGPHGRIPIPRSLFSLQDPPPHPGIPIAGSLSQDPPPHPGIPIPGVPTRFAPPGTEPGRAVGPRSAPQSSRVSVAAAVEPSLLG